MAIVSLLDESGTQVLDESGQVVLNESIPSDYRIPLYDAIFDALNGASSNVVMIGELDLSVVSTGVLTSPQSMTGSSAFAVVSVGTLVASPPTPTPLPPIGPVSFPTYVPPIYTYFATDLVTGTILGELPVSGVSLDSQLNSAGNMSASGNLDDVTISNSEFIARTTPGRTAFWAYRNNQIVWGGIVWTRTWVSKGKVFSITGQTFESYASRRFPRSALGINVKVYNQGQCSIINDLWRVLQGVTNGNIGVLGSTLPQSDIVRQLTVNGWDLSTSFDDLIQSILVFSDGPDYTITWPTSIIGLPTKQLVVAPRIGKPVGRTNLVIDYPGSIEDYSFIENAASGANQWWAVGDGTGTTTTTGQATDAVTLKSGWPLIEGVNQYSGVTDQATINAHAASDLKSLPMPLITHAADIFGAAAPQFGSYNMGDYVVANVTDPRFATGTMFAVRVIGWTIVPSDNSGGVETITLVFDEPTGSGT